MLRPQQVRQIAILGFALVVALMLLFLTPQLIILMRSFKETASAPPPVPSLDEAPPPPVSPLPPGAVILDGALGDLKDLTSIHDVYREPAYQKMLRNVSIIPEDALRERAERNVAYATFLKYAPELRGRIFRLAGEAMQEVQAMRLADPIEGRSDVFRMYMWDDGIEAGFVFDLVDQPQEALAKRDRIEIDGMFYKVVRYQNQRGEDRDVPLFVARSLRRLPPEPQTQKSTGQYLFEVIIGLGIVAVLGIAYLMTRKMASQRTPAAFRRPGAPPAGAKGTGPAPPGPA